MHKHEEQPAGWEVRDSTLDTVCLASTYKHSRKTQMVAYKIQLYWRNIHSFGGPALVLRGFFCMHNHG